ncbi:CDP-diacylglycerol--inositol 3-phosphatidyltransferase isoform X4 [Macaca fascicularis]|uniref:CDP-diacylglycerol--inositol 3-phosphatidyltransferase isoform X4 n=1 Tax=Macaca fascicularis TaxID=9541 RepID=UPI003D15A101
MPGLSSPSFLSTSCPAAPSRPPPSTCSAACWTLSMDTLLALLIKPALFTLCAGNELFYCLLYLLHFSEGPLVGSVGLFRMGLWVTAPIALLKSLISVIHLITAARNMAALDAADRAKKK